MKYKFLINIQSNKLLSIEIHDEALIQTTHFNPNIYYMVIGSESFGLDTLKGSSVIVTNGDEEHFNQLITKANEQPI